MEMYCDKESRGGILEPPGICEVKFRGVDQNKAMHRLDPVLQQLDADIALCSMDSDAIVLQEKVRAREEALLPLYLQVAHEFADLHDRSGRMKAKGVVRDVVDWPRSREYVRHYYSATARNRNPTPRLTSLSRYFFNRVRRRVAEDKMRRGLKEQGIEYEQATGIIQDVSPHYDDDEAFTAFAESAEGVAKVAEILAKVKKTNVEAQVAVLLASLSVDDQADVKGRL